MGKNIYRVWLDEENRYANDEELFKIKITHDGRVVTHEIEEYLVNPITGSPVYRILETDVSKTHLVEYGLLLEREKIYQNDIVKYINDNEHYLIMLNDGGLVMHTIFCDEPLWAGLLDEIEIVGNARQNPELVDKL